MFLLFLQVIAHKGEAETKEWLEGVEANLARKPQGNDAQVKAIKESMWCCSWRKLSYYLSKND